MAANEITFKIKVTKDGNLKVIAKDAEKAAKGTEKLGKSTDQTTKARDKFSRGEKGVAQAGMNTTKSFSKMRDAMGGGSSGLVGAYATLAANVFALTAAFGILQRAAAAQQLAEGLAYTGTVAGRNLPFIADKLKEITGAAVSTQEAMSAVALATSSGFSSEQISRLGEVAKGASLALGRDMTDALNRLVRGAAKLEPELLDELGIMVRLDDAVASYARKLGTTEGNLTQFQKRQAFVNAIIEEGTSSFAGIAEQIEPNAYDQLAASLSDLLKNFVTLLNKGLIPVAKFFSNSPAALVGGALLFASTIRGQLLPGLTQGAQRMANFAAESKQAAQASFANISTTGKLPKVYTELSKKIKDGTATSEDFAKAQGSLSNSLAKHNRDLETNDSLQDKNTSKYADKIKVISEVESAQGKLNNITILGAQAETASAKASAINSASKLQLGGTIKGIRAAMAAYRVEITTTALANGATTASFVGLRVALFGAATGFAALGVAILTVMPYLALIPVLFGLGKAAYDKFFGDSETTKKINEIIDSLDHLNEVGTQLATTLDMIATKNPPNKEWQEFTATLKANAGAAAQVRDRATEIISVQTVEKTKEYAAALERQAKAQARVDEHGTGWWRLDEELQEANQSVKDLSESFNVVDTTSVVTALKASRDILTAQGMDKSVTDNISKQITQIEDLAAAGKVSAQQVREILSQPATVETTSQLLEGMNASLTTFSEELNKMKEKTATPFDKMNESLKEAVKALSQTKGKDGVGGLTEASQALLDTINVEGSPLAKAMADFGEESDEASAVLNTLQKELEKNIKTMQEGPGKIKEQQAELKKLSEVRKMDSALTQKAHELEDGILNTKEDILNAEKANYDLLNLTDEQSSRLLKINAELAAIDAARKSDKQKALEKVEAEVAFTKMTLAVTKKMNAALKQQTANREKILRMEQARANFANPNMRSTALTAKQERDIQKKLMGEKVAANIREFKIKRTEIKMEYDLLEAKAALLKEQMDLVDADTTNLEEYQKSLKTMRQLANKTNAGNLITNIKTTTDTTASDEAVKNAAMSAFGQGETVGERFFEGLHGANAKFDELTLTEKFQGIHTAMQPMIEDFKNLGPAGEHVAAAISGFALMTENLLRFQDAVKAFEGNVSGSFSKAFDSFANFKEALKSPDFRESMVALLGALSSAIGGLAATFAAASANRIQGIDKEIEAEKKRDGQSAASVAKIKQLEKKKEQEKRKAFEVDKKMKMAQVVINTAAGIMMTYGMLGPFGTAIAVMIAAMGAAQLAMIAGMTYQGGGSAGASAGPSSVAVGKRREASDLSKSQSARGELAYFRGDQGIGGPENFRPAFSGRRNYATGGNMGYVVGEQGPELFMPDRPGTIVPADDTAAAMGGNTNVTFSINAIDASGVEEVLAQQQGNIIGMIRTAANSYGEEFMEDLDETTYTAPVARRA